MKLFVRPLPGLGGRARQALIEAGATLVDALSDWHVVRHPRDCASAPLDARLWLSGYEEGGPCSPITALVLIRAAVESGRPWVASGLGPRAMAATVALGAEGIVVGPELWLADDSPLSDEHRASVRGAGGRDTVVVGELAGFRARLLRRASPARLRSLLEESDPERLSQAVHAAIEGWTTRAEALVPAPQSIGGASTFARATSAEALGAVVEAVEALRASHPHHPLRSDPLGTGSCIVQGPMANVAEGAGLAGAVSRAGALPCLALGALRPEHAAEVVDQGVSLGGAWGVGVIGFDVAPHRDAHLDAIAALPPRSRPAAVVLAGGSPALARAIRARGLTPWLHTPSAGLVADALDAGAAVILEGHEAGGHVGVLSSLGLWEEALAIVEARPRGATVILAGGIGDPVTAATAGAMAASAAKAGATILLQVGTAFFFTHEALEQGAITAEYQRVALAAEATELVGSSANLALRCVPSPFTEEVRELERTELRPLGRRARRERVEHHNLGRTRVAAKGIERSPEWPVGPRYRAVPTARQRSEGAFTMGQGAIGERELFTTRALVRRLTTDAAAVLEGRAVARPVVAVEGTAEGTARAAASGAIAVVSLGAVLPGADSVEDWWRALLAGEDAVQAIPSRRWDPQHYWDPAAGRRGPARTRSMLAGAIHELEFDPLAFRLPPSVVPTLDRSQQVALIASAQAMEGLNLGADRRRAAVILGNSMGGEHAKSMAVRVRFREIVAELVASGHLPGAAVADIESELEEALDTALPPVVPDSMAGLLSNVVSGRVAAWLDWMGGNHTVDAACAASLAAVGVAVEHLRAGRSDAVLTGGVDTDLSPETFVGFSRTEALSNTGSHPFAEHADGFVMGEGGAVFLLRRLEDALAENQPIWAVIRGVGQASDGRGRGITAPRSEGQRLAIARATADAGLSAGDVRVFEAHGTGTPLGDATELGTMVAWLDGRPGWLGSAKSSIGHLKGAAGAAGLLKAILTCATGVLPPTLHAGPVRQGSGGLRLPRTAIELRGPARVGVSAFGFGGTDQHVIVEAPPPGAKRPDGLASLVQAARAALPARAVAWGADATPLVIAWGSSTPEGLLRRVEADRPTTADEAARSPQRLVLRTTHSRRTADVQRAAAWLREPAGPPPPGVHVGTGSPRPLVWMVPGQGSQHRAAAPRGPVFVGLPSELGSVELESSEPVAVHEHAMLTARRWRHVLQVADIEPVAVFGHSLGELGALILAGWGPPERIEALARARGSALAACPPGAMVAVRSSAAPPPGWTLAALNGPDQAVWSGSPNSADDVAAAHQGRRLRVARAYHSPSVAPAAVALRECDVAIEGGPVPVWSTTDAAPMRDALDALARGVTQTVRLHDTLTALQTEHPGALFVEVGPGKVLTGLARTAGLDALALDPRPGHPEGAVRAAAALVAAGHPGLLSALGGAWVQRAPALPELHRTPPRPRSTRTPQPTTSPELQAAARRVQDLRIAALADSAHAARYREARAALLERLAALDAGAPVDSPAATTASTPPVPREPPRTPPAPEVAASPVETPGLEPETDARRAVIDAICAITGYPPSVLEDDLDLEADLGVDSIKKMEILGLLQKRLNFQAEESDYARLSGATLPDMVDWLESRRVPGVRHQDSPVPTRAWVDVRWPLDTRSTRCVKTPEAAISQVEGRWLVDERMLGETPDSHAEALRAWVAGGPARLPLCAVAQPYGITSGFIRCLGREWQVDVCISSDRETVLSEALGSSTTLVGRSALHVAPSELTASSPLPAQPVIVASGGARGITNRCLASLGDLEPRILLLGRSQETHPEVQAGITRLREAGAITRYARVDIIDAAAVEWAVSEARAAWGPIGVVVHGAGTLRDRATADLAPEDISTVLGPKLRGARALMAATAEDRPRLWVAFGSLVAAVGNPGQALYAAANSRLVALEHPTATRSVTIGWTAWSEVGMASSAGIQAALAARGIQPISPSEGADLFRGLVDSDHDGVVWVSPQTPPSHLELPWPLRTVVPTSNGGSFGLRLDPSDSRLDHHRVAGRPLVPAATWLTTLGHGLTLLTGEPGPWEARSVSFGAPTFVDGVREDVRLVLERAADSWECKVLAGSVEVCSAVLTASVLRERAAPALNPTGSARAFYRPDVLFHGPRWQVLERVGHDGNGTVSASLPEGATSSEAIDGAHQLICAWAGVVHGWRGLPVGASRWTLIPDAPCGRVEVQASTDGDDVVADVSVWSPDGTLVGSATAVRLRRASDWPSDAPTLPRGEARA